MAIMLEKGHGKDGNPSFPYIREHPTNYDWREDIERLTHGLVNIESFRGRIWINTYHHHPPGGGGRFLAPPRYHLIRRVGLRRSRGPVAQGARGPGVSRSVP